MDSVLIDLYFFIELFLLLSVGSCKKKKSWCNKSLFELELDFKPNKRNQSVQWRQTCVCTERADRWRFLWLCSQENGPTFSESVASCCMANHERAGNPTVVAWSSEEPEGFWFESQLRTRKIGKWAGWRRGTGIFAEDWRGASEQCSEPPNVQRACPGQLSHSSLLQWLQVHVFIISPCPCSSSSGAGDSGSITLFFHSSASRDFFLSTSFCVLLTLVFSLVLRIRAGNRDLSTLGSASRKAWLAQYVQNNAR